MQYAGIKIGRVLAILMLFAFAKAAAAYSVPFFMHDGTGDSSTRPGLSMSLQYWRTHGDLEFETSVTESALGWTYARSRLYYQSDADYLILRLRYRTRANPDAAWIFEIAGNDTETGATDDSDWLFGDPALAIYSQSKTDGKRWWWILERRIPFPAKRSPNSRLQTEMFFGLQLQKTSHRVFDLTTLLWFWTPIYDFVPGQISTYEVTHKAARYGFAATYALPRPGFFLGLNFAVLGVKTRGKGNWELRTLTLDHRGISGLGWDFDLNLSKRFGGKGFVSLGYRLMGLNPRNGEFTHTDRSTGGSASGDWDFVLEKVRGPYLQGGVHF